MTRFYLGIVSYLFISVVLWLPRRVGAMASRAMTGLLAWLNLTPTQFVWVVLIGGSSTLMLGFYIYFMNSFEPNRLKRSVPIFCNGEHPTYILTDAYFGCPNGGYFTCPHGLETCEVEHRSRAFKGATPPEALPTRRAELSGDDDYVVPANEVFRIRRQHYHNDRDPTLWELAEQK